MQKWAEAEFKQADLGDVRRNNRLVPMMEDLAS